MVLDGHIIPFEFMNHSKTLKETEQWSLAIPGYCFKICFKHYNLLLIMFVLLGALILKLIFICPGLVFVLVVWIMWLFLDLETKHNWLRESLKISFLWEKLNVFYSSGDLFPPTWGPQTWKLPPDCVCMCVLAPVKPWSPLSIISLPCHPGLRLVSYPTFSFIPWQPGSSSIFWD